MAHDQFSDRSFRVFASKLQQFGPSARELIKEAAIDYDEHDDLPESSFAWPELRKYAVHSPEHAALSVIYAHGEALPPHVSQNLAKAAELYDLELPVLEKVAQGDSLEELGDYLVPQRRLGKIVSKGQVKEAAQYFSNNYKKMDLETRTHAAATLVKKSREYDCKISPSFHKHAGLAQTNPKILGEWLEVRANLAQDDVAKAGYTKLAAYVQDVSQFTHATRSDLIKLADTLALLDARANLGPRYDITLPDPLLTVFNTTKLAGGTLNLANKQVSLDSLMAIDPKTYGDILGADLVPEITDDKGELKEDDLMDVLKTLPADLQSLLVSTLGL